MRTCSGIRADGGRRCQAQPMRNSEWCLNHDPDRVEANRRRSSKGGKRGGRGRPVSELGALRDENAAIRKRLLDRELLPGVASVAIQSLNVDIRAVATTLRAKEQEEFEARLEELEAAIAHQKERRRTYGA
jgi:hypothetical protein